MVGALAGAHLVGMAGLQGETGAAIVQGNARARNQQTTAEAIEIRLNQRHHQLTISCSQVNRSPLRQPWLGQGDRLPPDQLPPPLRISLIQHLGRTDPHILRICHLSAHIGKGQLHCLNLQVIALAGIVGDPTQLKTLQKVERHQSGNALPVGGDLPDGVAAVICMDGFHPIGLVLGQVSGGKKAAAGFRESQQLLRQLPPVKTLPTATGNLF